MSMQIVCCRAQQALEEYRLLMQRPDDSLDLVACTSLIARHRYPLLDHAEVVEQLDDLAVQVSCQLAAVLCFRQGMAGC